MPASHVPSCASEPSVLSFPVAGAAAAGEQLGLRAFSAGGLRAWCRGAAPPPPRLMQQSTEPACRLSGSTFLLTATEAVVGFEGLVQCSPWNPALRRGSGAVPATGGGGRCAGGARDRARLPALRHLPLHPGREHPVAAARGRRAGRAGNQRRRAAAPRLPGRRGRRRVRGRGPPPPQRVRPVEGGVREQRPVRADRIGCTLGCSTPCYSIR